MRLSRDILLVLSLLSIGPHASSVSKPIELHNSNYVLEYKIDKFDLSKVDLCIEEINKQLNLIPKAFGLKLLYREAYEVKDARRLSKSNGAVHFKGHKETYYSQKVLPGKGLKIPGRHVADDGTIRDEEGYICVAADPSYLKKGTLVLTSLGPAKVYDTGCAYGTIDIYVNW